MSIHKTQELCLMHLISGSRNLIQLNRAHLSSRTKLTKTLVETAHDSFRNDKSSGHSAREGTPGSNFVQAMLIFFAFELTFSVTEFCSHHLTILSRYHEDSKHAHTYRFCQLLEFTAT